MIDRPLGKIDCAGATWKHPRFRQSSDQFVVADIRPALCIHDSSRKLPESARLFGDTLGQLIVIADGVGERTCAARASAIAVDAMKTHLLNAVTPPSSGPPESNNLFDEFQLAVDECGRAMSTEVEASERFDELGAVLTAVFINWPTAHLMHLGNNRAYHWRRGGIEQLTNDHTVASRLVDAGQLSARRAEESPLRNVVWNVVGTQMRPAEPECKELTLSVGDAIVLCSDGLAAAVDPRQIGQALATQQSAEQTCQSILHSAKENGLNDDATVVIARFADSEQVMRHASATSESNDPPVGTVEDLDRPPVV